MIIKDMLNNEDAFPVYPWCTGPIIARFLPACATASDILAISLADALVVAGK